MGRGKKLLIMFVLLFVSIYMSNWWFVEHQISTNTVTLRKLRNEVRLGDGCKHVFLDVGANLGVHVRMLFEPQHYNESAYLRLFEEHFGTAAERRRPFNESGICAFGFEGNEKFAKVHKEIEVAYAKQGWRVKFFTPLAVADASGYATFFVNNEPENEDWGSSLIDRRLEAPNKEFHAVLLPKVDFAKWMSINVVGRQLPRGRAKGKVVMKMDIEGAEYTVMPAMFKEGQFCQNSGVDVMTIETHSRIVKGQSSTLMWMLTEAKWRATVMWMKLQVSCTPTLWHHLDDESYLHDGVSLPGS